MPPHPLRQSMIPPSAPSTSSSSASSRRSSSTQSITSVRMSPKPMEEQPKWFLSPHHIRTSACACCRQLRNNFPAQEFLNTTNDRFAKVYHRLLSHSPPEAVAVAGERVARQLRQEGWELTHVVGKERPSEARREISIYFLVPCNMETGGSLSHRWVAEVLVHLHKGKREGQVETVAIRFSNDWEDWTVCQDKQVLRDESQSISIVHNPHPGGGRLGVSDLVMSQVWQAVVDQLGGGDEGSATDLASKVDLTIKHLQLDDSGPVVKFEIETVYLLLPSGDHLPCIRVALHQEEQNTNGQNDDSPKKTHVPATVMIETSVRHKRRRLKNVAVAYKAEAPMWHHYRRLPGPPNFQGLEVLVQGPKEGSGFNSSGNVSDASSE
ncbi:hypothetical protein M231_04858 [Tremella mesenterica]|uniref:Uncharacterized protein n=1 Tax=Tremella mesenterica TaxID=5217 RepID=A0A4Q1BJR9_TREME|nr:hypothetical protein M231_04858 [Tremella mesenterica]